MTLRERAERLWHRATTEAQAPKYRSAVYALTPSCEDIRVRHHTVAAGYGSPLIKTARLTYGYLAWPAETALLIARWLIHSPVRLAVTAALILLILTWM